MKYFLVALLVFALQSLTTGCAPVRDVGDPIGEGVGQVSDELGGEKKLGKGDDAITIHPQGDKKIKVDF